MPLVQWILIWIKHSHTNVWVHRWRFQYAMFWLESTMLSFWFRKSFRILGLDGWTQRDSNPTIKASLCNTIFRNNALTYTEQNSVEFLGSDYKIADCQLVGRKCSCNFTGSKQHHGFYHKYCKHWLVCLCNICPTIFWYRPTLLNKLFSYTGAFNKIR